MPVRVDEHAADARLGAVEDAVVVGIDVDRTGEAGRDQLGEGVAGGHLSRGERDRIDHVRADDTAGRPGSVDTVVVSRRTALGHGVGAGAQPGEAVSAREIGGRGEVHGVAEVVGAGERDGDACDAGLGCVTHTVVVVIDEHGAGDAGRGQFAEGVAGAGVARDDRDGGDDVVAGGTAESACGVDAVEVCGGMRLGDLVGAGAPGREAVGACGVGDRRHGDRVAAVVGAGEGDGDACDAGLSRCVERRRCRGPRRPRRKVRRGGARRRCSRYLPRPEPRRWR